MIRGKLHGEPKAEKDGWTYSGNPEPSKDCRKLVTLRESGMEWIGIRAWNHQEGYWMNNSEPERCDVLCWRDLPDFPRGFWVSGQLHFRRIDK